MYSRRRETPWVKCARHAFASTVDGVGLTVESGEVKRATVVIALLSAAACGDPSQTSSISGHHKPTAPVTLELTQRSLGGASYEVTLTARPTTDVTGLELVLDGKHTRIGSVARGVPHTTTMRVQGEGRTIIGSVAVDVRGHRRTAAADVVLGTRPVVAPPPSRIVVLPDGTRVDEVRP